MFVDRNDQSIDAISPSDNSSKVDNGPAAKKPRVKTASEKKIEGEKRAGEKIATDKKATDKKATDKKATDKKAANKKAAEKKAAEKMVADKMKDTAMEKTSTKSFANPNQAPQTPDMKTAHAASKPRAQLPAGMRSDLNIGLDEMSKVKVHSTFNPAKTDYIHRHSRMINPTNRSRSPFKVPRRTLEQIIRTPTPSPPLPSLPSSYHPLSMENLTRYQATVEDVFDEEFERYQNENSDHHNYY
jgi:hypothetical protein